MTENEYSSKIDVWLACTLSGAVLVPAAFGINALHTSPALAAVCFAVAAAVVTLLLLLAVPCRYTLSADHLLIRSGIRKHSISFKDIRSVEQSNNPLAAPALSLQRVKISYGKSFVLISPERREEFIRILRERANLAA
jgi:membrane protein YdbS with pleckstrin-like domain